MDHVRIDPVAMQQRRWLRGLTLSALQVEVSALRGEEKPVSLGYLSDIERGVRPGSPRMLALIAKALDCSPEELLAGPDDAAEVG